METSESGKTGSNPKVEPAFILIGYLQKAHGIHGEIAMRIGSDFQERLHERQKVYLGEAHTPQILNTVRAHQDLMLISFNGIDTREAVETLTNLGIFLASRDLPALPAGKYYHHQLIGLKVWQVEEYLGIISEILETGANDVYVIRQPDGGELLIPAIESVIREVDLVQGRMEVSLLEGLRA